MLGCRKGAREELLAARPLPCAAPPESNHIGSCCCAICPGAARLLNGLTFWLSACACAGRRGAQAPRRLRACPARRLGLSSACKKQATRGKATGTCLCGYYALDASH